MNSKQRNLFKSTALTLVLVIGLIAGAITTAKATNVQNVPADLTKTLSIDVGISSVDFLAKVPEGNHALVYDLYKIADAQDNGGGIVYNFDEANYGAELAAGFKDVIKSGADGMAFAQKALAYLYGQPGNEVTALTDKPGKTDLFLGTKISPMDPGMYLLVVRGAPGRPTVLKEHSISSADINKGNASEGLTTCVTFDDFTVTASPQIVSLPMNVNGATNAATSESDWIYDLTYSVKISVESLLGSIQINKELVGYNPGNENATFVFQVDVYKDDKKISSEVYSTQFTGQGNQSIRIDSIPIGAKVIVKEVYSGVAYKADVTEATIPAVLKFTDESKSVPRENQVDFRNTYDDWQGGGGGITNRFERGTSTEWVLGTPDGNAGTQNGRPMD